MGHRKVLNEDVYFFNGVVVGCRTSPTDHLDRLCFARSGLQIWITKVAGTIRVFYVSSSLDTWPTEKTFSRRPYNSVCNWSEMKSGISFMPSLLPKSSLSGDITHNTFNSVKENIFTVRKHSRHIVTNVCPRPVLPCWYCVGWLGENNQLVLAGSATLMCGKLGILSLSIGIDYVCGSLCLWIDTIRLKRRGRKEGRRRSRRLREWICVCVTGAHEKGEALWAPAAPFLITLTHMLSMQGNWETRECSSLQSLSEIRG